MYKKDDFYNVTLTIASVLIILSGTTLNARSSFSGDINAVNTDHAIAPFVGVNMHGYHTTVAENRNSTLSFPPNYYESSFKVLSNAGMKIIRFLTTWESYEKNSSAFLSEIQDVAQSADKWGMKIIYVNDQFHISSWLDPQLGYGFPSFLFKVHSDYYPYASGGGSDQLSAKSWWINWFNRTVSDGNGDDGWQLQADFMKKIVNLVDSHKSTLGYEIINEPQVYSTDQWEKIGKYNTFITSQLRTVTQKVIVFDRQLPSDIGGTINAFPENMAKMAPLNKTNTLFKSTLYGLPTNCSYAEDRLTIAIRAAQLMGVPMYMGEFNVGVTSLHPVADINQTGVNIFIDKFLQTGLWGFSFWIWSFKHHPPSVKNFDLVNFTKDGDMQTTKYFDYFRLGLDNLTDSADRLRQIDTICPVLYTTKIDNTYLNSTSNGQLKVKSLTNRILIAGKAYDVGKGIKAVEIKLDTYMYIPAVPTTGQDWSNWTASIPIAAKGIHNVLIRATDNGGNKKFNKFNIDFT